MAMGRDEERTVLVELGALRPFSDIAGRHTIKLNDTSQRRQELAQRLQAAGCSVNLEGTDWHSVGNSTPLSGGPISGISMPPTRWIRGYLPCGVLSGEDPRAKRAPRREHRLR